MKNKNNLLYILKGFKQNLIKLSLATFFIGTTFSANAQIIHKEERFTNTYKWKIGLSMNMVDMNFNHKDLPDGAKMATMAIPSKITLGYEFVDNLTIELGASMNKLESGNYANGTPLYTDKEIYTVSGSLLYSLGGLLNIPIIDPYVKAGVGYLSFGDRNYTTADFGGGLNIWLGDINAFKDYRYPREKWYQRLGINIEALGKRNITNKTALGSHAQFSAGIFYMF